jgi:hypothetical protein
MTDITAAHPAAPDPRRHWAPSRGVLMSYAYLGSQPRAIDSARTENVLRLREDLRTRVGAVTAAPLAIAMLDAALVNMGSTQVRAVTQVDVAIIDCAIDVDRVLLSGGETADAGSQLLTEARIYDADDTSRRIGFGSANWTVLGMPPQRFCFPEPDAVDLAASEASPPLWQAFSGHRRCDGLLEIPRLLEVGVERLHYAPMLIVAEAVALEHATHTLDTDMLSVDSLSMTMVAPGLMGPFVAEPVFSAVETETVGCRVELRDAGRGNHLVAVGFFRVQAY